MALQFDFQDQMQMLDAISPVGSAHPSSTSECSPGAVLRPTSEGEGILIDPSVRVSRPGVVDSPPSRARDYGSQTPVVGVDRPHGCRRPNRSFQCTAAAGDRLDAGRAPHGRHAHCFGRIVRIGRPLGCSEHRRGAGTAGHSRPRRDSRRAAGSPDRARLDRCAGLGCGVRPVEYSVVSTDSAIPESTSVVSMYFPARSMALVQRREDAGQREARRQDR